MLRLISNALVVKSVDSKVRSKEIHLNLKSPAARCASSSLAQGTK